jgi:hypothetical protein
LPLHAAAHWLQSHVYKYHSLGVLVGLGEPREQLAAHVGISAGGLGRHLLILRLQTSTSTSFAMLRHVIPVQYAASASQSMVCYLGLKLLDQSKEAGAERFGEFGAVLFQSLVECPERRMLVRKRNDELGCEWPRNCKSSTSLWPDAKATPRHARLFHFPAHHTHSTRGHTKGFVAEPKMVLQLIADLGDKLELFKLL